MKEIFLNSIVKIPLALLEQTLNTSDKITDKVDEKSIEQLMNDEINDWKGDLFVDESAALVYDFTLLRESQIEMEQMRAHRQINVTTGQTVFDTGVN